MASTSALKPGRKSTAAKTPAINNETPVKRQIKLPFDKNNQIVPADQLKKIPKREDDEYLAGDLVWVKTKGFPWWACMITVDPETGKYSKTVVIREKNNKAFHVQYFGKNAYRGYTQGNIMKYEGKEKYELKLDQIKNTPTPNKSQRKMELTNYEIKNTFKKDWSLACDQADEAMKLERAARIERLTFEYIVDRPKSSKKQQISSDEEDEEEEKVNVKVKSKKSETKLNTNASTKKRKAETQQPTSSKNSSTNLSANKKKKRSKATSDPTDVYDFNEFDDEDDIETPKKPFELSSAKRAKGEFLVYAKQLRADIARENPDLDDDEIEAKLKRNWELMPEDMRNSYAPRPSLFQSNLSFQLESPSQSFYNRSLNEADISLPDLNSSLATKDKKPPNKASGKRGRKPKNETSKTNKFDFEKENALDTEEMNNRAEESSVQNLEEEKVVSSNRRSSRKKLFNQGNETVNENSKKDNENENKVNKAQKRRSSRMSTGNLSKEDESTIKVKKVSENVDKDEVTNANKTPTRKSSRQSTRLANSTKENELINNQEVVEDKQESVTEEVVDDKQQLVTEEVVEDKQQLATEEIVGNKQQELVTEENGVGSEENGDDSCSSESDKTTEHQKNEENKERYCAKCHVVDKGLIKCDGDCLEYYHAECFYQEKS